MATKSYSTTNFYSRPWANAVFELSEPAMTATVGLSYYDIGVKKLKIYDGTQWVAVGGDKTITYEEQYVVVCFNDGTNPEKKKLAEIKLDVTGMSVPDPTKTTLIEIFQSFDTKVAESASFTIKKQDTAETGYLSSYKLMKTSGGSEVQVGDTINIPMDYLVTKAEVKECTEKDKPVSGLNVGDKYVDFTINVKTGTGTESHIYIKCNDMAPTLIAGDGIAIADNKISVNLSATNANGLNLEDPATAGNPKTLAMSLATDSANGAMTKEDYDFLHGEYLGAYTAVVTNGTGTITIAKEDVGETVGHNLEDIYMASFIEIDESSTPAIFYDVVFDTFIDVDTKTFSFDVGTSVWNGRVTLLGLRSR